MISVKKDLIDLDLTIKFSASTDNKYCESTGKCNSMVELFTSTGRYLDNSTITFSTSTGKEYSPGNSVNEQPNKNHLSLRVITKPVMTLMNPSTSNRRLHTSNSFH